MSQNKYRRISHLLILFFIFSLFLAQKSFSADFSIAPVRIFFDGGIRTSILTVTNESEEELQLQLNTFEWQQDDLGKDIYTPTKDIIFFPKIFKIPKGEEKLVRIGTQVPPGDLEKTYRIYLEELPGHRETNTTAVRILMRIGVPIFIEPIKQNPKGSITKTLLQKGKLAVHINNEGNSHFIIKKIDVRGISSSGEEVFKTETGGGYLHADRSKKIVIEVPPENCLNTKSLEVTVKTDKLSMVDKIVISKEMCGS